MTIPLPDVASSFQTLRGPRTRTAGESATSRSPGSWSPCSLSCSAPILCKRWSNITLKGLKLQSLYDCKKFVTYLTKCWKMYLSTAWLARGIRSRSFLISRRRIARSGIMAICSRSPMCSGGSSGGRRWGAEAQMKVAI